MEVKSGTTGGNRWCPKRPAKTFDGRLAGPKRRKTGSQRGVRDPSHPPSFDKSRSSLNDERTLMRRTPSPPVTREMAAQIKRMRSDGLYNHQIAAHFGINQGRVSEVNTGKRFPDVPPEGQPLLPF